MRACGILMPVFSLPGPYGIGTLGREAYRFVDFLVKAKQSWWQILPIGPTGYGDSPYQSFSAFAGNPYFIDFDLLAGQGFLEASELPPASPVGPIRYDALYADRPRVLGLAADRLLANPTPAYQRFCAEQAFWLEDYALFMSIKEEQGQVGLADWPDDLRCRQPEALARAQSRLADRCGYFKAVQFFFYDQWTALKAYANSKGVRFIGDIPIYVSPDSSDLWTRPELFQTDGQVRLTRVAGCPPDSFAADGQLWGNPLYDWPRHAAEGFAWWKRRMRHATSIYDMIEEANDYYFPTLTRVYLKAARALINFLTIFLTPVFLLFMQNLNWLPEIFAFVAVKDTVNIPLIFQLLMLEIAIDGLRLAALNTPSMLSTPLSVIAGLVMGEFSVKSGWFNSEVMLYMAFVAVANYTQPNFELGYALKFMRLQLLVLTALFNWVGFAAGCGIVVMSICFNRTLSGRSYLDVRLN